MNRYDVGSQLTQRTIFELQEESEIVTISGYHDVPLNNEQSLMKALANQPLSVAIDASGRDFQFYSGGVFDRHCGTSVDHSEEFMGTEMGRKGL
ncbi:hypothetical protein EZV62_021053 [Acer yangbiense]|uniref:Peptidase C1A papain C-terminal domain-containing protein n=1 Tax=Acer yangbiense TaxID=1000413 RepID=A0A5C7H4E4_9ROSI|nr:hypothetical protein EZV62_021053 [Acer yangbiense]